MRKLAAPARASDAATRTESGGGDAAAAAHGCLDASPEAVVPRSGATATRRDMPTRNPAASLSRCRALSLSGARAWVDDQHVTSALREHRCGGPYRVHLLRARLRARRALHSSPLALQCACVRSCCSRVAVSGALHAVHRRSLGTSRVRAAVFSATTRRACHPRRRDARAYR